MSERKHLRALTQAGQLPSQAQQSALEIKKDGLIEAGNIITNVQRAAPWFNNGPFGKLA